MNQIEQKIDIVKADEIDLIELFKVFWKHKLIILLITAVFTVGSIVYALRLPNIYTADVMLAPVSSDGSSIAGGLGALGGIASLAGISTTSGGDTTANIAVIKSRQFIIEFIKENDLLPILFYKQWDYKNNKWAVADQKKVPTLQKGYTKFSNNVLNISENKKTGLIALKVSWYDPELSAKWANMLVLKANSYLKQNAISEANQSISYLKDQINTTSEVGIQELLYKLLEKELQTTKLASVRKDYAFKVLDPALVPEVKSKPKRSILCVLGMFLGFIVAILASIIVNYFYPNGIKK